MIVAEVMATNNGASNYTVMPGAGIGYFLRTLMTTKSVMVQVEFEPRQAPCCVDPRKNKLLLLWSGSMSRRGFTLRRQTAFQPPRASTAALGFWWAVAREAFLQGVVPTAKMPPARTEETGA
jgi:hypothetical protein